MSKIKILDSMCGTGKTSYAIQEMSSDSNWDKNYIYITPYLDEVKRIKNSVKNRNFKEPNNKNKKGSKLESFKNLIIKDEDIASTHALFTSVDNEVYELLKSSNYTLILDEVMNVIETYKVTSDDFNLLVKQKIIEIDNNNKIIWLDKEYTGKFIDIKLLAENDNLYLHSRNNLTSNKVTLLVWTFPVKIFECFKEIYILTYMFDGQMQRNYYDMYGIEYEYKSVKLDGDKFVLSDYINYNQEDKRDLKEMINIYEGKLNMIGEANYSLSSTWLKNPKNIEQLKKLKNNTYNFFRWTSKTKSNENMWTTLLGEIDDEKSVKTVKSLLSGKGYTNGFVSCNCRATNEYAHKKAIAYLINRFINPMDEGFFRDKGVRVNEDLWALSELIQFIWRSAIRNKEPITIYIPSKRMRELLVNYLNNEVT